MSRISDSFILARTQQRRLLIAFITAGDPTPESTVPLMRALVDAGVDIIELGVPFSDPMAEGPVIQAACERALLHHINIDRICTLVEEFRRSDKTTPVVLMGYLNPIEVKGYDAFATQVQVAGVDGVLTVDLPPEEAQEYCAALTRVGLDTVFLVAPTSTPERIQKITAVSRGFVYYVALKGVTGAAHLDVESVESKLEEIRRHSSLPIAVGFGIKDADSAARIARVADAVVVGSAVVACIARWADEPTRMLSEVKALIAEIRLALDEHTVRISS